MHITFIGATVAFILFAALLSSMILFAAKYKPRRKPQLLSPAAYEEKMSDLENQRMSGIEQAGSQMDIDLINAVYDQKVNEYKLNRR